jgi:hypothetical protein
LLASALADISVFAAIVEKLLADVFAEQVTLAVGRAKRTPAVTESAPGFMPDAAGVVRVADTWFNTAEESAAATPRWY